MPRSDEEWYDQRSSSVLAVDSIINFEIAVVERNHISQFLPSTEDGKGKNSFDIGDITVS